MMDDEDFLELESSLRFLAASIGASEVMNPRHYYKPISRGAERDEEGRAMRPLNPRDRVIAEIEALDRHLSLFDVETYHDAMKHIQSVVVRDVDATGLRYGWPAGAVIEFDDPTGTRTSRFEFETLPDLSEIRFALKDLASNLRDS
jgi:hypothetical protein